MKIDVHKVTEGVAVTKYRLAQWIGHLEKTMVQQGETIVKTNDEPKFWSYLRGE